MEAASSPTKHDSFAKADITVCNQVNQVNVTWNNVRTEYLEKMQ